jgi:hypothetical protein
MSVEFDVGYAWEPFSSLASEFPDGAVYPLEAFRVEWGPIFHRGRLDGSARVVVIGQDPAAHEAICRRVLVGEAGQRIQGFLAKLGVTRSYVFVNTFLYSVYGQGGGERHVDDEAVVAYRNRWLDAVALDPNVEALISLGHLADRAAREWRASPTGSASTAAYVSVLHPTYPESASAAGSITKKAAFARLCESWNQGLTALQPVVTPDEVTPLVPYGATIEDAELAMIPAGDLPAGLPAWMRSLDAWASRSGADAQTKRATITVQVPTNARSWPPIS